MTNPNKNTKLKVEWLDIGQLNPYLNNPKEHPPEQIAQIASSIQEFGFNDPIAIDEENIIIEGHGRLLAAQSLALEKVPVIRLEHMGEAEKKAYMIAHNKLTLNSGWDLEKLQVEIETLKDLNFEDITLTGFTLGELQGFGLREVSSLLECQEDEDTKSEVSINYQNQYGVIVTCDSEAHQQRVYDELIEAGYPCKVVVV